MIILRKYGVSIGKWTIVSSNYNASSGDNLFLDSTVAGIVVSLPSNPTFGDSVVFDDGVGNCGTNNVTISGSGEKILGLDENFLIDFDYAGPTLTYYDIAIGWTLGLVGYS